MPADAPAKLVWSATVYDIHTRCLVDNDQQRGDRGSRYQELVYNNDGSVDLHFGPDALAAGDTNWVQTIPGRHWFPTFASAVRLSRTSITAGSSATSLPGLSSARPLTTHRALALTRRRA